MNPVLMLTAAGCCAGQLKESLEALMGQLKQKDNLILKYEQEIRRRNDEIEKKQYEVDRLNRRFDSLVRNMQDENMGPLEATINNLLKEISGKADESSGLQRSWIRSQTELVTTQNDNTAQAEAILQLKSRYLAPRPGPGRPRAHGVGGWQEGFV